MSLQKVAKPPEEYRPCRAALQAPPGNATFGPGTIAGFLTHDSLQMTRKNDSAIFDTHRQIGERVYTSSSRSNLRFTPPRRFRMAIQAHLVELERKHKVLEHELHEALVHLSTDDLQILELKRRKLMVKDEIERLRHTVSETLH
jgi:hypothetical protein